MLKEFKSLNMNTKTDIEIINTFLSTIVERDNNGEKQQNAFVLLRKLVGNNDKKADEIVRVLQNKGLIDIKYGGEAIPNQKTKEIVLAGGIEKFNKKSKEEEKKEEDRQKNKDRYYYWQGLQSEWLCRTKWWPIGISLAALAVSIVALFKN